MAGLLLCCAKAPDEFAKIVSSLREERLARGADFGHNRIFRFTR